MASMGRHPTLLVGLVTLLVMQPLLTYGSFTARILFDGLFAVVLLGVVFTIFGEGERRWALVLGLPVLAVYLAHYVLPDRMRLASAVLFNAFTIGFIGLAVAVILRDILRKSVIGGSDVLGAISGYLLSGVAWATCMG